MENEKKGSLLQKWKKKAKSGNLKKESIEKAPDLKSFPLSHGQKRIWFLQQLNPNNPFYNLSQFYEIEGRLDTNTLKTTVTTIFNNHRVLKSFFELENGIPYMKINYSATLNIREVDLSNNSFDKAEKETEQLMFKQAVTKFNLTSAPLFKATLIKKSTTSYILFLTLHHIITDQWSMDIFRDELISNYQNVSKNSNIKFGDNKLDFIDYAFAQNSSKYYPELIKFWKEKLNGVQTLKLPLDFKRPLTNSYKGKRISQEFSKQTSSDIFKLAQELKVTPFILSISLFYLLLYNYSRQEDITIGIPFSNRNDKRLEQSIGLFIETLTLRANIRSTFIIRDFIDAVQHLYLEAISYKDLPFNVLVKELNLERSLSVNPLFQVMFVYASNKEQTSLGENLELIKTSDYALDVSKFDLTLFVTEKKGVLTSTFEYATDLFEEATIIRFQEHLKSLFKTVAINVELPISEIDSLTTKEQQILNKSLLKIPIKINHKGIHNVIENICLKYPKNTAVTYKNTSITYADLNSKADNLAKKIISKNTFTNAVVGLCVERQIDMIVGLLGILKSGCCYLPIDPSYPRARIDFILNDSETKLLITQSHLQNLFDSNTHDKIIIDELPENFINDIIEIPEVNNNDLAYIIYTSGSTGKPKGVPISHENIMSSTLARFDFYENIPKSFLLMSSISFDSSKVGVFWTLCTGGNLVLAEKRIEQDINKVGALIHEHQITHTLMLPSLYNLILDYISIDKLKSLNTVIVAGEACSVSLCRKHFNILPRVNLYNEYGPTEASVWCIAHKITGEDFNLKNIPIGKPVANSEIYILDDDLKQVPIGVTGEIFIGGQGLSKGYIKRDDLTQRAFVKNPYKTDETLYKTGDLGKFTNSGVIHFAGRKDDQIKIRGFRVELSEIENTIKSYSSRVNDVIVLLDTGTNKKEVENLNNIDINNLATVLKNFTDVELNNLFNSVENLSLAEKKYLLNQI